MCVHHKVIYGADNRSMHHEVQGQVRGRGSGGLSQKVHHPLYQPIPPTKWSDSKNLEADKVWNLKHFQEKIQQKEKKTERKNVQDTPLEPLLINFTSYQTVVL